MLHLPLREYELTPNVRLTPQERDALREVAPSVKIEPTRGQEQVYDLTPGSWIGAINLGTLSIAIQPKLSIDHVLFLISYALDPKQWRQTGFDFRQQDSVVEAIIPGFVAQVRRAFRRGVLQGYRTREDALQTVRGRVRFDDQIRDRFGICPPVEVRYDEFTEDITENRLIKAAIARLGRLRIRSDDARRVLRAFDALLTTVESAPFDPRALPEIHYTRLNEHFRPAVELAKLILQNTSFDLGQGPVRASSFLVDMNRVFEDFVVVALREALGVSERTFPQGASRRSLFLDRAKRVKLEPDISWWDGMMCTFVGDVKYKHLAATEIKHADLYQLHAYATAAALSGGLLIYAAGEAEDIIHEVVNVGKRLQIMTLDLQGQPAEILADIRTVADRIREMREQALTLA